MHWGGGTPTFLNRRDDRAGGVDRASTSGWIRAASTPSRSIRARWRRRPSGCCAELGFNRISLGVQDFDPQVQKAVNRIQSEEQTRAVIDGARRAGFRSVNVDLIYGLPKQNVDRLQPHPRQGGRLRRPIASRCTTTRTCPPCSSRSGASPRRTCPPGRQAAAAVAGDPAPDRSRLSSTSAWTTSPSRTTSSPWRSGRAGCTATSRATRPMPRPTCWASASRRSARSGRPTARTSRRWTSTTTGSTAACCRSCAGSS